MGTNSSKEKETPRERANQISSKPKVSALPENANVLKPSPWVKNTPTKTPQRKAGDEKTTQRWNDNSGTDSGKIDGDREEYIRQQNNNNKIVTSDNAVEDSGDDIMKSVPVTDNHSWRGHDMSGDRGGVNARERDVFSRGVNRQGQQTEQPVTYAEKHAREQYKHDEMRMYREKTIYRNPDEWEDSDEEEEKDQKFDVSKFKEANKGNVSSVSGLGSNTVPSKQQDDFDMFFPESRQRTNMALPDYDPSEEDLIASIEKEYT